MSNYHIDDIFRENLREFETTPPPSVWANIDLPQPIPFYKKPFFISSVVIGFLFLLGLNFFINRSNLLSSQNISESAKIHQYTPPRANSTHYLPIRIPFSPDFLSSVHSDYNSNTIASRTIDANDEIQAHTDNASTSRSSTFLNGKSKITRTQSFENTNDEGIPSPYLVYAIWEPKPVNTPFNIHFNTSLIERTANGANHFSPYFNRYALYTASTHPSNATTINNLQNLESLPSLPITSLEDADVEIDIDDNELLVDLERDKIMSRYNQKMSMTRGFHIGGFTSAHNNWILNPALKETVTPNSKLTHQLDFGYTYGLAMGYEFSRKWGLQLEWIVNSEQGQRFTKEALYNAAAGDSDTDINLTYTYFPVLLKYRNQRMFSLTKQPLVVNYIAGIQYGMLKSAEINIENPIVQDDLLQLSSWGFVWGMDYDFYLNKNYFLTFGARTSLSTSSDSRYKPVFPTTNTSNRLLIGLRASFNYQFD